jgi:hypothetical protein
MAILRPRSEKPGCVCRQVYDERNHVGEPEPYSPRQDPYDA